MRLKYTLFLLCFVTITKAQTTFFNWGTTWKFLDDGSNQNTAWYGQLFNDNSWATGLAELGYGDGDEATTVSYGSSSSNKYITTYFRKSFNVANPALYSSLLFEYKRDDGIVIYLNGTEVHRDNMPGGTITFQSLASGTVAWPNEDDVYSVTISPGHLLAGNNVIAVEIHQDDAGSSDISFDGRFTGSTAPITANVIRGPYLQEATTSGITIRWRTDVPTDSRVFYGAVPGNLNNTAINLNFSAEHEVTINGLAPALLQYYSIGTNNTVLLADSNMYFKTNPVIGSRAPFRFWVIGDAGEGNTTQRNVRDAFIQYNGGSPHADGWLLLGDNAYDGGFDAEYQVAMFQNMYESTLTNTALWPAPGNHDYNNHIPFSPAPAYYDIFNLPVAGQSGGVASGTEKYYSYDYANVHFISLDSYDESRSSSGAMATWLLADLAANTQEWTVAYWHHPPYTKGTHDSDNPLFYDFEMVDMRQNILPILENAGVDLILCGHSHTYERSHLIDAHYGNSGSFNINTHALDASGGNYPAVSCPYEKNTISSQSHKGTVYAVVGCSAKTGSPQSSWPHPAMYTSSASHKGSLVLNFEANRLDADFVTETGSIQDHFTIIKNAGVNNQVQVCPGDPVYLVPSWPGAHEWFPGNSTADSLLVNPLFNTLYYVSDSSGCLRDTFVISTLPSPPCPPITTVHEQAEDAQIKVYPSILAAGEVFQVEIPQETIPGDVIRLFDTRGVCVTSIYPEYRQRNSLTFVHTANLGKGIYYAEVRTSAGIQIQKIIIY